MTQQESVIKVMQELQLRRNKGQDLARAHKDKQEVIEMTFWSGYAQAMREFREWLKPLIENCR